MVNVTGPLPSPSAQIESVGLKPDWYIGLSSVLLLCTTLAIILRGYVRIGMLKSFGSDDAALFLAYIVIVALACVYIAVGAQQKHQGVLEPFVQQIHLVLAAEMLYIFQAICLKIALAAFFLRIVHVRWQRWVLIASVSLYTTYQVAFAFTILFQCGSIKNLLVYQPARCLPWHGVMAPLSYISAALNAIVDWIMVATTVLVITGLKMNRRDKLSVCFLLLLGLLGSIVSIVRIPLMSGVEVIADISFFANILPISFCSIIESALGTIALSLAALRPLFRHVRDRSISAKTPPVAATGALDTSNCSHTDKSPQAHSPVSTLGSSPSAGFGLRREPYNDNLKEADDTISKSDLVDFPTSIYSSGRRHQRLPVDEEWYAMGQIRLEVTTTVSSSRSPPGFAAGYSTNAFS